MEVYLDNAATTKIDSRVVEKMKGFLTKKYYNPSSLYKNAKVIRNEVEQSREIIAQYLNVSNDEIIFTSGGTEADNLAIKGVAWEHKSKGKHLITSSIEHHAVLSTFKWLEEQGFTVTYLPVDKNGLVSLENLEKAIRDDTILISIMFVNNVIGTIQPIERISKITQKNRILFHVDAVQALGIEDLDIKKLGVDLLAISAHKIYGPKGTGALFCKKGVEITPLIHGGQQEHFLRGGTEAVANIVGFGKAISILEEDKNAYIKHLADLKQILMKKISRIPDVILNGDINLNSPKILSICIKNINIEALIIYLGLEGIQVSMGSACTSSKIEPSHVLKAIKVHEDYINGCIRISLSKYNSIYEINYFCEKLNKIINMLRKI